MMTPQEFMALPDEERKKLPSLQVYAMTLRLLSETIWDARDKGDVPRLVKAAGFLAEANSAIQLMAQEAQMSLLQLELVTNQPPGKA
jgi:hypothetical protein